MDLAIHLMASAGRGRYLVATQDQAIAPDAERAFASRVGAITVEVSASHVAMVSHPAEVAADYGRGRNLCRDSGMTGCACSKHTAGRHQRREIPVAAGLRSTGWSGR